MSKGPSTFRKTDVKRGIAALELAGKKVARVEIDKTGKIILFPANGGNAEPENSEGIKS
jgi:hypothetical protein